MARAKHAHLPALAHDLLHLADRFGMVHAIGAEAHVAGPVTKLHRRTTPVPLLVSEIPSSRPSCPRAGRRTGTYRYLVSNKHGMGPAKCVFGCLAALELAEGWQSPNGIHTGL